MMALLSVCARLVRLLVPPGGVIRKCSLRPTIHLAAILINKEVEASNSLGEIIALTPTLQYYFEAQNGTADACPGGVRILLVGMKTYPMPPDYTGITIPERPKLRVYDKVPALQKVVKEPKNLKDIRGPYHVVDTFKEGQYGIVALGGGYLRWGHFEMMRLTINRNLQPKTMFACWRVPPPHKPITRKGLGQRMGGGKGAVDHYVTPVKCGQLVLEVGGFIEFGEIERILIEVAKKLPFLARAVSRQTLAEMYEEERCREMDNQNPWTFGEIARANMLGCRKFISPFDVKYEGRYRGKYKLLART